MEIESQCSLCMYAVFASSLRVMKRTTWEMFITSDLGCRERKMKRPSLPGDSDLLYQYPDTLVYKAPFEKVAANEQHTFFSVQENNNCSPQKNAKKLFPVAQTTSILHQPGNELFLQPHFPSAMTREQESTRMRRRNARGTENVDLILQTRLRKRPCEKTERQLRVWSNPVTSASHWDELFLASQKRESFKI